MGRTAVNLRTTGRTLSATALASFFESRTLISGCSSSEGTSSIWIIRTIAAAVVLGASIINRLFFLSMPTLKRAMRSATSEIASGLPSSDLMTRFITRNAGKPSGPASISSLCDRNAEYSRLASCNAVRLVGVTGVLINCVTFGSSNTTRSICELAEVVADEPAVWGGFQSRGRIVCASARIPGELVGTVVRTDRAAVSTFGRRGRR